MISWVRGYTNLDDSAIESEAETMYKKIFAFLTSTLLCLTLLNPAMVKAAEIETSEMTEEFVTNKDEIQKKNEELYQKWDALTQKQKNEIYKSVKATLDAQAKFLDKLVKYELMTKEDAQTIKDDMYAKFDEMKANDALFSGKPRPEEQPGNGTNNNNNTRPETIPEVTQPAN